MIHIAWKLYIYWQGNERLQHCDLNTSTFLRTYEETEVAEAGCPRKRKLNSGSRHSKDEGPY